METYKQTTAYTSAQSSLLLVLNHFNKSLKLSMENEFNLWIKSANLPTRGPSLYALAVIAKEYNINAELYVGKKEYNFPDYRFKGYTLKEVEEAQFTSDIYLKRATEKGIVINSGEFEIGLIKDLLQKGKFIIQSLDTKPLLGVGRSIYYPLIVSYRDGNFIIIDKNGLRQVSEKKIKLAFDNVIKKRKRHHQMLVLG